MDDAGYDPFSAGPFDVEVRELELQDGARGLAFPCDVWHPVGAGDRPLPLIGYSHHSGGHRRVATFLMRHLASHGYAVAALDHSEVVDARLRWHEGETPEERAARIDAIIAARVPDLVLLLDSMLSHAADGLVLDATRAGLVGHSFGGWTVLATPDVDPRVRSVVAHGPGGSSTRRPGILPLSLDFAWGRDVPVLYLAAENDVPVQLSDVREVFERTPGRPRMVVLRRADHQHFVDDVETVHEAVRTMELPPEAAWLSEQMRPIAELCSGDEAHRFVRGLTLAHLDASLRGVEGAAAFLDSDVAAALAERGVEAFVER